MIFHRLAQAFQLGKMISCDPIEGGFSHPVFKMITEQGAYVIKALGGKDTNVIKKITLAEQLFLHHRNNNFFSTHSMVYAEHEPYCLLEGELYQCTVWIEGTVLPATAVTPDYARMMARCLARLHTHSPLLSVSDEDDYHTSLSIDWSTLIVDLNEQGSDWNHCVSLLKQAERCYNQALEKLDTTRVISHRDLYQGNVVWQKERPVLIDWENAGRIHPRVELFNLALNWSGFLLDEHLYREIIHEYERYSSSKVFLSDTIILVSLGSWLQWFCFNAKRRAEGQMALCCEVCDRLMHFRSDLQ